MLRRAALVSLLVFQSLWLSVIVPGHTRGAVTLPGYKSPTCEQDAGGCPCSTPKKDPAAPADPARAAHCAVCFFAARLTVPVAIDLTPQPLEPAFIRAVPAAEQVVSLELSPTYLGRAPPLA